MYFVIEILFESILYNTAYEINYERNHALGDPMNILVPTVLQTSPSSPGLPSFGGHHP